MSIFLVQGLVVQDKRNFCVDGKDIENYSWIESYKRSGDRQDNGTDT